MSQRQRMPVGNRVSGSSALEMTGIWKETIGYDPYKGEGEVVEDKNEVRNRTEQILKLAKLSNLGNHIRGACERCGQTGHLTYQCRNHLQFNHKDDDDSDSLVDNFPHEPVALPAAVVPAPRAIDDRRSRSRSRKRDKEKKHKHKHRRHDDDDDKRSRKRPTSRPRRRSRRQA